MNDHQLLSDLSGSSANRRQRHQVLVSLRALYRRMLRRGIHGEACVSFSVQDGTIQHVAVEQKCLLR